ncbi:phosphoglycerate mutase family protein [Amniculicola lignicola CBS 123094]|uniref:Phosphoglycerate mutase family protein n=1 Tax=Amniculicola lignicola CBS 123094 TaxID=1392246 RepID=A0A6A5VXR0_9PLEO|nr:phosphoglycerate mutase family protein [Amniculicola lignicola CBS 123094]
MLDTIYVIRHAFRANWAVDPQTGEYTASTKTPTGIPTDPPLTSSGVGQSKELAERLIRLDPPIDRIYSSPFYRCLQTLKPTTDRLFAEGKAGRKIRIERGFGEFYGLAPFTHPSPPNLLLLNPHFPNLDQTHKSVCIPCPNGELLMELHHRVKATLDAVIESLDDDPKQPKALLISSHAASIIAMGRVLTGDVPDDLDTDDFQCYTAGLSRFERRKGSDGTTGCWDCVLNSDTSFLSGGAERGWHFNGEESFDHVPQMEKESKL